MMSQADSNDLKDKEKLEDDSFAELMSQCDDKDFNLESPVSKKSNVENWLVTSEPSKKEVKKIYFQKKKVRKYCP